MIEIALKNCKLCCDYNQKATATEKESLILGFHRLRDEALEKVLQHLSEYFENCGTTCLKNLEKGSIRDEEVQKSLSLVYFAMDLSDMCQECDYSSPKLLAKWNER